MSQTSDSVPERKNGGSGWFLGFLFVVLAGGLGTMQWLGNRKQAPETAAKTARRPSIPIDGVLTAGRPTTSGPARAVFEKALPDFVIALDAWEGANVASNIEEELRVQRGKVVAAATEAGMHEGAIAKLGELLDTCIAAKSAPESKLDDAADQVFKDTQELNNAVATSGLGFFVDVEVLSRDSNVSVLLFSFEVDRVVLYRSEGRDVRTLRVRRLDNLNWAYNLLGFTSPERDDAVVLDDKVDGHLLKLLPLLAPDSALDPFELEAKDTYTEWFLTVRARAVRVVAAELRKAGPQVLKLGELVAKRYEIYRGWNKLLAARKMSVELPTSLEISWDYRRQMEGLTTHSSMDKLDAIQDKLTSENMRETFALAQDHFAQSVERHETQHRLDLAGLYTLPMPEELAAYVGELPGGYQGEGGLASGALAEMSAYLSELARDPLTPHINLTLLTRYLLNRSASGMSESYAALAIFEGLAAELHLEHPPLVARRRINRAAAAELYLAFTDLDSDTLQDASMTLWHRYFGRDLPVLELIAR